MGNKNDRVGEVAILENPEKMASNYTMNERKNEQCHRLHSALTINPKNLPG